MFVLNHQLHKPANLLTLLAQVGIEQRFIPFAAAPQDVVSPPSLWVASMAVTTCVAAQLNTSGSGLVAAPAP
nr:Uncharacterised protein [Raoultella sp. NCTC 9187]